MEKSLFRLFVVLFIIGSFACGEDALSGPEIDNVSVSPATISLSETGMTDEFFTVDVTLSSFDGVSEDDVRVFFVDGTLEQDAEPESRSLVGNTLTFNRIQKAWFTGVGADTYDIGVEVITPTGKVKEVGLTTMTVEP